MDNDRVEGKAKDIAGRVKRQVGEWTGDNKTQAEGAADQAEGKVQNAWGKLKDAGRDAVDSAKSNREEKSVKKEEIDREEDVA